MPKKELNTLAHRQQFKMSAVTLDQDVFNTDHHRELYLNFVTVKNVTNDGSIAVIGLDRGSYVHCLGQQTLTTKDVWYKFDIKQWLRANETIKLLITSGNANDMIEVHISGHYR